MFIEKQLAAVDMIWCNYLAQLNELISYIHHHYLIPE